jgi:hypothetical protein
MVRVTPTKARRSLFALFAFTGFGYVLMKTTVPSEERYRKVLFVALITRSSSLNIMHQSLSPELEQQLNINKDKQRKQLSDLLETVRENASSDRPIWDIKT